MANATGLFGPDGERLGSRVQDNLRDPAWTKLKAAVAFAKESGVKYIAADLNTFSAENPGQVDLAIGIDHGGSSLEAVQRLFLILSQHDNHVYIVRNPIGSPSSTYHPKLWVFSNNSNEYAVLIGSGNLTQGGLFTNYEASVEILATRPTDDNLLIPTLAFVDNSTDDSKPEVVKVTTEVLSKLRDSGELPSESALRRIRPLVNRISRRASGVNSPIGGSKLFTGRAVGDPPEPPPQPPLPPLPVPPLPPPTFGPEEGAPPPPPAPPRTPSRPVPPTRPTPSPLLPEHRALLITVRPGQKTELYLTKGVLVEDPAFFGAPFMGRTVPKRRGNVPQPQPDPLPLSTITVYGSSNAVLHRAREHPLKMWTYSIGASANDDFRLTLPAEFLRDVPDDTILVMTRDPEDDDAAQYRLDLFPPGHPTYPSLDARCTQAIPNSTRRYGWE